MTYRVAVGCLNPYKETNKPQSQQDQNGQKDITFYFTFLLHVRVQLELGVLLAGTNLALPAQAWFQR